MKKFIRSSLRGQTLVEFALILPAFLLLVVFIFDFGRAVYYYSAIHNAAREGARYGAVNPIRASSTSVYADIAGMKNEVIKFAVGMGLSDCDITFADIDPAFYESAGGITNATVRVEVEYKFYPVTPLVSQFICGCESPYLTLKASSIMRTEWRPIPLPYPGP
jgi:hypothetical protein